MSDKYPRVKYEIAQSIIDHGIFSVSDVEMIVRDWLDARARIAELEAEVERLRNREKDTP